MKFPFEVPFEKIQNNPEPYVAAVFSCLESEFLQLPKGPGFVEYAVFEQGYETLKRTTAGFSTFAPDTVLAATLEARSVSSSFAPFSDSPRPNGHTSPLRNPG